MIIIAHQPQLETINVVQYSCEIPSQKTTPVLAKPEFAAFAEEVSELLSCRPSIGRRQLRGRVRVTRARNHRIDIWLLKKTSDYKPIGVLFFVGGLLLLPLPLLILFFPPFFVVVAVVAVCRLRLLWLWLSLLLALCDLAATAGQLVSHHHITH